MDAIAFIFARGGSKGLPGKNILPLCGKPLIAWAIEHAKAVPRIRRVIVSTDTSDIADMAREWGAEVPFLRPEKLAKDDTPEWLAWQHALNYILEAEGSLPDVMVSVPTTAPLRLPADIELCLDLYEQGGSDMVITVTEARRNPCFNMVTKQKDGCVSLVIPPTNSISRRQSAPAVFDMTTLAYVANPKFVQRAPSIFSGRVKAVDIPVERAIDIDTAFDFELAEWLMAKRMNHT